MFLIEIDTFYLKKKTN